jgi:hypothetical protein
MAHHSYLLLAVFFAILRVRCCHWSSCASSCHSCTERVRTCSVFFAIHAHRFLLCNLFIDRVFSSHVVRVVLYHVLFPNTFLVLSASTLLTAVLTAVHFVASRTHVYIPQCGIILYGDSRLASPYRFVIIIVDYIAVLFCATHVTGQCIKKYLSGI